MQSGDKEGSSRGSGEGRSERSVPEREKGQSTQPSFRHGNLLTGAAGLLRSTQSYLSCWGDEQQKPKRIRCVFARVHGSHTRQTLPNGNIGVLLKTRKRCQFSLRIAFPPHMLLAFHSMPRNVTNTPCLSLIQFCVCFQILSMSKSTLKMDYPSSFPSSYTALSFLGFC